MGTSNPYEGPSNNTPLVPTWLNPDEPFLPIIPGNNNLGDEQSDEGNIPNPLHLPETLPIPVPQMNPFRFTTARANLTQFARSGGSNRASLGRAISQYVTKSSGGSRHCAHKMGFSRKVGSSLLSFINNVTTQGIKNALATFHLEGLIGHPLNEVLLGLTDFICPDGGNIDEGIARDAFIETIVDLTRNGIVDFDDLNSNQLEEVFILYISHTIEDRLYNDIGIQAIQLPTSVRMVKEIQSRLWEFIHRCVCDAVNSTRDVLRNISKANITKNVDMIYESSFSVLRSYGEVEGNSL